MNLPPELPISAENCENMAATVQAAVLLFWRGNQTLREQVAKLESFVDGSQTEVARAQVEFARYVR